MATVEKTLQKLSIDGLKHLNSAIRRPKYDPRALSHGIAHIGVGNFHRAHQACYMDTLFNQGTSLDWAITGAGVMQGDARMRSLLKQQDYLSTVVELAPEGHRAQVVASMIDFAEVAPDNGPLVALLSDPATRIASLTVTEGGYYLDGHGAFDATHADIAHDASNPDRPRTAFGAIVSALRARRNAGLEPFTVMSCDNLPGNGHVAEGTIVGLAALSDPEMADWISGNVAFPNGMVDRITPATGDRERRLVAEKFGLDDPAPVTCESYAQWVLEDKFTAGRPALEDAGVTFTNEVAAFEAMKIRILNGGHAIIAYPGGLLDVELVHKAMEHPLIRAFLQKVESRDIVPIVPPVPGTRLDEYLTLIVDRFSNPDIGDTIRRLCFDGSNRQPKFIIPSIADNLAMGRVPEGLCLLSALWCRYCFGETESGRVIESNDPRWSDLQDRARTARENPDAWIEMTDVYGDLAQNADFRAAFASALANVWRNGTAASIEGYLAD